MTIDEAIRELEEQHRNYLLLRNPNITKALKLGVEALKHHRDKRGDYPMLFPLLPGETEN